MDFYAIYLRKSRQDTELEKLGQGETLSRHRTALLEVAKAQRLNIVKVYEEIVSGDSIASRPQMQALLSAVEQGEYNGVLVMEIERLARGDSIDQGIVAQTFKATGTKIITPYKTYDPNSEIDEEYFEFGLFMARREYKTIKRRLLQGRLQCIKEGKHIGNAPYGYKKKKLEGQKGNTIEPIEEQATVVRMIFDLFVNGLEQPDGSRRRLGAQAITKRLNQLGIPAIKREHWFKGAVREILQNPTYKGYISWGKRKSGLSVPDGKNYILVKGLHEPIISEKLFDETQELIKQNPVIPVGAYKGVQNPLAGLVKCAVCGRTMIRRVIKKDKPAIMTCSDKACPNMSSYLDYVEKRVLDVLKSWILEYKVNINSSSDLNSHTDISLLQKAKQAKENEISKLKKQLDRTHDLLEQGVYSVEQFTNRSQSIGDRISEAQNDIKTIKDEIKQYYQKQQQVTTFIPKVEYIVDLYYNLSSAEEQNRLLKEVIKNIIYYKAKSDSGKATPPDGFVLEIFPLLPDANT